ncbi:MAG TPA: phosphoribosylpyrophosphate synthetase [Bacteroidia bacterium]|nr:phosphoribosylpyrophosphate synthetase [Bacteroidia bacterium]HQU99551.1 phosphoribosylpyrophosphate synthetase [Bacteroidia bacterium]HRA60932.1 phosphoribosylpyrophosphate synthetase [Bacteroidia bacterium]HRC36372.1 phosphoribosylpyrophosphate synthetase [Bacteroidia bacterium]
MKLYTTLSEAINDLTKKGYITNFNINQSCIECGESKVQLQPSEFEIERVYRFQDMSDVDNEDILYVISSKKNNMKGLLVNAYGIYSDSTATSLIDKLKI